MDNAFRLRRASRRLRLVFSVIFVLIPLCDALAWLLVNNMNEAMTGNFFPSYIRLPLPPLARLAGFLVTLVPAGFVMHGILSLVRLFRLYEAGEYFREANVRCFRDLSRALVGWAVASLASQPVMSILLTLHHPKGERLLVVGLHSIDVTALLVGMVLAVIAWVMDEGRKLREEQEYTV